MSTYNTNSPAVRRILREVKELHQPTDQYHAAPIADNIFEWHFTVRGPPDSDFAGGRFHGRIVLPAEYPMKPPAIYLLTPNGRFELNRKICLTASDFHPEHWQSSWSIRTVLLALIGFMPSPGMGAIGALDYTPAERRELAAKSLSWTCASCGACMATALAEECSAAAAAITDADRAAISQMAFKAETPAATPAGPASPAAANGDSVTLARQDSSVPSIVPPSPLPLQQPLATETPGTPTKPLAAPVVAPPASIPIVPTPPASDAVWNIVMAVLVALIAALVYRMATRPRNM